MKKRILQEPLESKYEILNQYDYNLNDDDVMEDKEEKYASYIGSYLIWFSNLEHCLDIELANFINERAHDEGYIIIKDLEIFEKIELFYNLVFPRIFYTSERKANKLKDLINIKKDLEGLTMLRNKIAHAKWNTLDKNGYVRVDTKTSKENGQIKFRKFKITLSIMMRGIKDAKALEERLSEFTERVWHPEID
jgi:hypothetical protein